MKRYKICPTCQTKNSISNYLCDNCLADLTMVEEYQPKERLVKLINKEYNISIILKDGDILGRDYIGKDKLKNLKTISRKHAQFFIYNGDWIIEDLDSTNGSYINGKKIKRVKLKDGLKISISKSVEFNIEIV